MAGVLGDQRLYEFIGGEPHTTTELRKRYARLVAGSPDPDEVWLNRIVRRRSDAQPTGTVQATLTMSDGESTANVAWVIRSGPAEPGVRVRGDPSSRRLAAEARCRQRRRPHPSGSSASEAVALRAGLRPADEQADGERVWRAPDSGA